MLIRVHTTNGAKSLNPDFIIDVTPHETGASSICFQKGSGSVTITVLESQDELERMCNYTEDRVEIRGPSAEEVVASAVPLLQDAARARGNLT